MARRASLVAKMMREVILYGGLPARRCDVYTHALGIARTYIGTDNGGRPVTENDARRAAERYAFLPPAIDATPLALADLTALDAPEPCLCGDDDPMHACVVTG